MPDRVLLGQYRVVQQIDEGGMSQIFLGRSLNQGREVAIKILHEHLRRDNKARKHFQREIHVLSKIGHPNVVAFLDASLDDPQGPVLVMEHIRGTGLDDILVKERRLTPQRVGRIVEQLCSALTHIHSLGIVHRDLKPSNIKIIYPGTPHEALKLLDFGLASLHSALYLAPEDIAGGDKPIISGTPQYVSPEQALGQELDGRGDLYSLGVLLFQMLTGQLPFNQESVKDLLAAHETLSPPTFSQVGVGQGIPPGVEAVVQDCLAKSPSSRPQNATQLNDRFQEALGHQHLAVDNPITWTRPRNAAGRRIEPVSSQPALRCEMANPNAHTFHLHVTMPESMALVKLKGFVHDLKGEIIESIPGMIRVYIPEKSSSATTPSSGIRGWFQSEKTTVMETRNLSEMLLYMEKQQQNQSAGLGIRLVIRPKGMATQSKASWRSRCEQIFRDLQAYLIGR
jgi:eukaryotic-like serine/threonine-protein kinase